MSVVIGLALAVILDTSVQLFWKSAVLALPGETESWGSFLAIFREPLFLGVVLVMSLQFANWMSVLSKTDLSFAQPVAALSYVSVGISSVLLFNEPIDGWQVLGIALVLAGVGFISRTGHVTKP
ncbi:MAG: EamA family transporter [Rhodomicrobium sp.]|nr:EamA family transporter [Rhodomicrobium sp.]